MIRTIKDATVKRFHYESHEQLRRHLRDFIDAYNFARRLKSLTHTNSSANDGLQSQTDSSSTQSTKSRD